ncbi:response regulator transcription factor [Alkalicoccobacillus murimartini]|uniref:DNA-binding response OmpR family regulator n=1 Tax=Alkalicoccobacillus murimartini TaxID=171685 RepID=A0ABT9YLM8_9BACI|nr:response regulator transcription factor [Alkalicoccobacillus murimartini]MDQ0208396.1 DNA-binding response OmpR family regulator [Alkalicoccobacillus murimartini]
MYILLVEDDQTIAEGLSYSLKQEGFDIRLCANATDAKTVISQDLDVFSLCIFDLSLPDGNGYELCQLVKEKADTPVIFLTAMDEEVNVVMGLDMGADDYITKPFRLRELISRIKTVLRRSAKQASSFQKQMLSIGPIKIHTLEAKVYKYEEEIVLTALEYRLLIIFANHVGQVLTRSQLFDLIWDVGGGFVNDNTLTVYIKRLREKLEDDPQRPVIIQTVRGLGYKAGEFHATR